MRILFALHHRGIAGGNETYVRSLLPLLRARGHELAILHEQEAADPASRIDSDVAGLPVWDASVTGVDGALRKARAWAPDVVFQHGLFIDALEAGLLELVPSLFYCHTYYGTCISGDKHVSVPRSSPCDRRFGPGCLVSYLPRRCGGLNPVTALTLYRRQQARLVRLRRHRRVLVASRHMYRELARHGVAEDRLVLAPYFPTSIRPDVDAPGARERSDTVLFVGRLTELKGGALLVRALPLASKALGRALRLVVLGDGPERATLEREARRLGVQVRFEGWVDPARRTHWMRDADLLAVPSLWPEPFGMVGIEAGCVGLPSVAFPVGGIPDWLRPGGSGEAAALPASAAHLAEAIVRALGDDAHHAKLRRGAWEVARSFDPASHLERLEAALAAAVTEAAA